MKDGFVDFLLARQYRLAFSAVFVVGGFFLVWLGAGTVSWTLTILLGFPLVAPFAAVGLYEVSRRIEAGLPLEWRPVLAAEVILGAALAYLLFAMTLVSLPLLLEKEIDLVTAMLL